MGTVVPEQTMMTIWPDEEYAPVSPSSMPRGDL
jgi:hypothetical protein